MTQALSFLTLAEVPLSSGRLFRVSAVSVAAIAVSMGLIVTACIWFFARNGALFGAHGVFPAILLWWIVLWLGLFLLFYGNDWRKALRPGAWLALATSDGVYIKYRSYQNAAWGDQDLQVVFVPYRVIATARIDKRTWLTPASQTRRTRSEQITYVELELIDADLSELMQKLADERTGKPGRSGRGTKVWRHFPVSVEPGNIVRIEWRARPSATAFTEELAGRGVNVQSQTKTKRDLRNNPGAEQILELARRGQVIDLIRVLRVNGDMTLAQAKSEAERLIAEAGAQERKA